MSKINLLEKTGITPKRIINLMIANVLYALALNLFYVHNNIAAGGLAGIGTVINSFFPVPVGVLVFLMNIPICLWGLKIKGKQFIILSMAASGIYSLIVDILSFLPSLTDDKLVAVICGGILYGTAASFSARAQISAGGTDLLAKLIITKKKHLSLGTLLMCIDGTIVVFAMLMYREIEAGIYAILAIAICSLVMDKLNSGFNRACLFYIITDRNSDAVANAIMNDMVRGVTGINGTGLYQNSDRRILLVVVKPHEVPRLKEIIRINDPHAFVILANASEIIGEGFERLNLTSTVSDEKAGDEKQNS